MGFFGQRTSLKIQAAKGEGAGIISIMHSEYRWRKVRNEHIKHESCCQMCSITRELEVHHIRPWHLAPDLRYTPENLITLCRDCHYRFGHWLNWKNFNPEIQELCKYATALRDKEKLDETNVVHTTWHRDLGDERVCIAAEPNKPNGPDGGTGS